LSGICDNVSDIAVVYAGAKIFPGVIDGALLNVWCLLSRSNY